VKADHHISEGTIERYVRRELAEEERRSFEEHLLDCPECFEEVQTVERFVAGVRDAARSGSLAPSAADRMRWLPLSLAAGLAVVLIGGGWKVYTLERSLDESLAARDTLNRQLSEAKPAPEIAAANLPIAVLNATRAAGTTYILKVPVSVREIAVWMEVEPDGRHETFDLNVSDEAGRAIESVPGLARNGEGAVAVVLPATKMPVGRYILKLASDGQLLAQYTLEIAAQK
jgi:putative zinc finger protein